MDILKYRLLYLHNSPFKIKFTAAIYAIAYLSLSKIALQSFFSSSIFPSIIPAYIIFSTIIIVPSKIILYYPKIYYLSSILITCSILINIIIGLRVYDVVDRITTVDYIISILFWGIINCIYAGFEYLFMEESTKKVY